MNWLKQLVSDGEQPSTMRVMLIIIVLTWAVISIRSNTLVVPDVKVIGFLGTLLGVKSAQSFAENIGRPVLPPNDKP